MVKKWIAYSVIGVVGLGLLAGGAGVAANALELRGADGEVLPGGGAVVGDRSVLQDGTSGRNVLDQGRIALVQREGGVSIVTAPSPREAPVSVVSAPTPAAPAPAPPAPAPPAPDSPASVASAPSPASPPVSPPSPVSAASVASAASD